MIRYLSLFFFMLIFASPSWAGDTESAYERIMRTGEIRCGYMNWPPGLSKDPNTGEMSGIMVDIMNELGKALDLKIVWAEELSLVSYIQDLNNHRYDMECTGDWPNALRGKLLTYSTPLFYFPLYAVVRADDARFDNHPDAINDPTVRLVTVDGETSSLLHDRRFPLSTNVGLPASTHPSDVMLSVATGKADVAIMDMPSFITFEASNPDKLRLVKGAPLRVLPNNTSFAGGEFRLQQMLNTATRELLSDGVVDRILKKYETREGTYLRVAPPYVLPLEKD